MKAKKWEVLHSSKKEDWGTPQALFNGLAKRYGPFDLDAAASAENAKCKLFFDPQMNSLELEGWQFVANPKGPNEVRIWLNPPYGRSIGHWMEKAYEESQKGARVVCLVPSRTGSRWFNDAATRASEVIFIVGRITFIGGGVPTPAPFDSAVIVFDPDVEGELVDYPKVSWITREELVGETTAPKELK